MGAMCELCMDHSVDAASRMAAAGLLASLLKASTTSQPDGGDAASSRGGPGAATPPGAQGSETSGGDGGAGVGIASAAIQRGAFVALAEIMDTDHRQGSGGVKEEVVLGLAALASDEELRDAVVSAAAAVSGGGGAGSGRSSRAGSPTKGRGGAGAGGGAPARAPPAPKVPLNSGDDVMKAVLRMLWGAPAQLHLLMSSDRTKKGKTVDPKVVEPLYKLCTVSQLLLPPQHHTVLFKCVRLIELQ